MSLQMATNITPDVLNGEGGGAFVPSQGLQVSWDVNGNSPLVAYQIRIDEEQSGSTVVNRYNSGKVTLSSPFYGHDYLGNQQRFDASFIAAASLSAIAAGKTCLLKISQWWGSTDSEKIEQSSPSVIKAWENWTPAINGVTEGSTVSSRLLDITGQMSGATTDGISAFRWVLERVTSGKDRMTVQDTGYIFGSPDVRMKYDRLFTGEDYAVKLTVMGNSGIEKTSEAVTFHCVYSVSEVVGFVKAAQSPEEDGICVNWSNAKNTPGEVHGSYTITDERLNLTDGYITWDTENGAPMHYSNPWSVWWQGRLPRGRDNNPVWELTMEDGTRVSLHIIQESEGVALIQLKRSGVVMEELETDTALAFVESDRIWRVIVTGEGLYVMSMEPSGGLHPADDLYPDTDLYPESDDEHTLNAWYKTISFSQGPATGFQLDAVQECDFFHLTGRTVTQEEAEENFAIEDYEPEWEATTYMLCSFEDGLNAGNLDSTGYLLYRMNLTTGEYVPLAQLELGETAIVDYGAVNGQVYQYYLYYETDGSYTKDPLVSNTVALTNWSWTLVSAMEKITENGNTEYRVEKSYPMRCNVQTGSVSNNNKPEILRNFTRYPSWQADNSCYRTGTLTALIGDTSPYTNNYRNDTTDYEQEIRELSLTDRVLFLKDRKGTLMMVRPSGAITTEIEDDWQCQAAKVSFPWVEVENARDAVLVRSAGDEEWPDDMFPDTRIDIQPYNGRMVWTYVGSRPSLRDGYLWQTSDIFSRMARMQLNENMELIVNTDT